MWRRCGIYLDVLRHVVDFSVQQHRAGAERQRLIGQRPRCPVVDPQDFLFVGDDQLFLMGEGGKNSVSPV